VSDKPVVHVIDDDEAMRDSMAFMLEMQGFEARLHDSATRFLEIAATAEAGCIVTDVRMPGMTGLELIRALKARGIGMPVVVMTGHGDVPLAVEAMKAGVVDFVEKPFSDEVMVRAVRTALTAPPTADAARQDALSKLEGLSPRERDVLLGVVAGKANKVIAHDLQISPRTVEIYRANLMTKTGARNMPDLMRLALAAGL
jgi:two-component system, LuxR family, response regulator FixJ